MHIEYGPIGDASPLPLGVGVGVGVGVPFVGGGHSKSATPTWTDIKADTVDFAVMPTPTAIKHRTSELSVSLVTPPVSRLISTPVVPTLHTQHLRELSRRLEDGYLPDSQPAAMQNVQVVRGVHKATGRCVMIKREVSDPAATPRAGRRMSASPLLTPTGPSLSLSATQGASLPAEVKALRNELRVLRYLHTQHPSPPHVVRLLDGATDRDLRREGSQTWLVLEHMSGGDVLSLVETSGAVPESTARVIVEGLLRSLAFIHRHNVIHRDVKAENLVLAHPSRPDTVKLIDFGCAVIMTPPKASPSPSPRASPRGSPSPSPTMRGMERGRSDKRHRTVCPAAIEPSPGGFISGTPGWIAPEVLHGHSYNSRVDCFGAGVLCFVLVGGYHPFLASDIRTTLRNNRSGNIEFGHPRWGSVSLELKDLIQKLTNPSPLERISAAEALRHPWFTCALRDG
ncbi:unnamed protein product [Vitrella brassicaformis CCMP3155]|uniref:Protein kinase domain-containing protein n=2 Tax=Vitrella brassicaformis TaxID=1169539 RepID=A0A0G4EG02_VITBC|nr:unnamed protein product [Vitrella brassicaformis CCMP3155]|mmetsp:Transcript_29944/g.86847  ORF Transcript_29944/g.86847 Transcript_29944/m.86847 type:complete len:455 (+) Transcript_29944:262-1626(+)|eukprot:CEL94310.1 unnamed protein product [Vitrella brassicaformis CCMP3155]